MLWGVSHSEGDAGHSLLRTRRAQRASLDTTVYRVVRWLTLGISKFPSWPQSIRGNSGILTATIQFQYLLDHTVLTFTRPVWLQASGVPGAVRGCLIDPTHCSCTNIREVPSHPSTLLLQYREEYNVGWFWDCQVKGRLHHHSWKSQSSELFWS